MDMELVAILRLLWRHRLLVLGAGLIAMLVGLSLVYRIGVPPKLESRHYDVGIGSATALVDTPNSQVVDLGGDTGSDIATLSARAGLLASLMTSSPIKDEIAARSGIKAEQLITGSASATGASSGADGKQQGPEAYVLRASIASVDSGQIPIISVKTQAPDAAAAGRLANDAVTLLQEHIRTTAGSDKVPVGRRVVVRQLGPANAGTESRGPSPMLGLLAAFFVFAAGCGAIVGAFALARGWRQAAALERLTGDLPEQELEYASAHRQDGPSADDLPAPADGTIHMPRVIDALDLPSAVHRETAKRGI
jgi:hypothetical protein